MAMVNKIILVVAFLLLFPAASFAAVGEICGTGIDEDATGGDAACAEPDKDRDGYPSSSAYTGPYGSAVDCDDTNRNIYPGNGGRYVNVGAGTYKTCQTDGTYTGTLNVSAFTCHTGSGATWFFDEAETDCTGAGTYADPEDYRCVIESGKSGYHTPVAGDCYVFMSGSYTATWSDAGTTRMVYLTNKDGTSSNPITFMEAPGESADIVGQGVSPTEVQIVHFIDSSYIKWYGIDAHGGFSNAGIFYSGSSDNGEIAGAKFYEIAGVSSNNLAGIKASGTSHAINIHHVNVYDNWDRDGAGDDILENNYGIVIMDLTSFSITDSIGYNTVTGKGSHFFSIKHGASGGSGTFKRNVCFRGERACFVWEQPTTTVANNYSEEVTGNASSHAFEYRFLGNGPFYDSGVLQYNTVNKSAFFELFTSTTTVGSGSVLNAQYNVVVDNRGTSYPADGTDGFVRIGYYGPDSQYTSVHTGGKLTINNNCYYQSASVALFFTLFGSTSGGYGPAGSLGADYASFAAWQAVYDGASFNENPTLNADHGATSSNCSTKGWNKQIFSAAGGGGSSGTTLGGTNLTVRKSRRKR